MKFLFFLVFTFFSLTGLSQQLLKNKTDSINLLSSKWEVVKSFADEKAQDLSDAKRFLLLRSDGKYEMILTDKVLLQGTWKLDTKTKTLTTSDEDGTIQYKILLLSNSNLKIETTHEGEKMRMELRKRP